MHWLRKFCTFAAFFTEKKATTNHKILWDNSIIHNLLKFSHTFSTSVVGQVICFEAYPWSYLQTYQHWLRRNILLKNSCLNIFCDWLQIIVTQKPCRFNVFSGAVFSQVKAARLNRLKENFTLFIFFLWFVLIGLE